MLSLRSVAARPDFDLSAVACRSDHTRWSPPEVHGGHRVVLVRSGRFRRRSGGTAADLDPSVGYLGVPGEEEAFAHPAGGDRCTAVIVTPALWRTLAGDGDRQRPGAFYVDPALDLAHRRVLRAARDGDVDYALTEELLALLATAVARTTTGPAPCTDEHPDRALVAAAREAIAADHPAAGTLLGLADLLDASPYRLSRAFPRELGVTVTHYRHRVRLARALDRLEAGETSLSTLAADLGYADQAHLTRTARRHLGRTPTALRRLLAGGVAPGGPPAAGAC
ncbi:helix-turn-helix domain-containing protein [Kitasatospora sp. CB01950]|uniref:helix-turn-helix domain-containing protein n=1 Tax=Kitasatospora sp. CB01950 TaxID=1703930 RepID=UPI000938F63A|nr:helix-turn-helix domain-containing protein [Kitasatospora sp. CB01950]OKJ05280.1 AraC family transcriptional regulator [Kitasatospora sp. CB01950]